MLNQFFDFYFLNIDSSLDMCFPRVTVCTVGHKNLVKGSVSEN